MVAIEVRHRNRLRRFLAGIAGPILKSAVAVAQKNIHREIARCDYVKLAIVIEVADAEAFDIEVRLGEHSILKSPVAIAQNHADDVGPNRYQVGLAVAVKVAAQNVQRRMDEGRFLRPCAEGAISVA
jgi:hypothetical protein